MAPRTPVPPPPRIDARPVSMVVPAGPPAHGFPEIAFRVPDGWEERTVVAFALDCDDRPGATFLVSRIASFDANEHAARELMKLARTRPAFELREARSMRLGDRDAIEQIFAWTAEAGRVEQRLVYVQADESTVYVLACTCAEEDGAALAPAFQDLILSFRVAHAGAARRAVGT